MSRLFLNDLYGRGKYSLDMRIKANIELFCSGCDWVISSLPYGKGTALAKMLYAVLSSCRACSSSVILKLPISVLASRGYRAPWWREYCHDFCLVLDPLVYDGFTRATINSEVFLVWLKGSKAVSTKTFNIATL
jgi:hypothetical protein